MSKDLIRLIYSSIATNTNDSELITNILAQARRNNPVRKITGILLFCNNRFFQILEGEKHIITEMFEKVKTDIRHHHIEVLRHEKIAKRGFDKTSMGFINLNPHGELLTEGMSNFEIADTFLRNLNQNNADTMLEDLSPEKDFYH